MFTSTLNPLEQEIVHRIVSGEKTTTITKALKVSYSYINKILHREDILEEIDNLKNEIRERFIDNMADRKKVTQDEIEKVAYSGVNFLNRLLSNEDRVKSALINATPRDFIASSYEALRLAGYGKPDNQTNINLNVANSIELSSVQTALEEMKEWNIRQPK